MELAHSAFKHGESYSHLTDQINQKLTGQRVVNRAHLSQEESSPGWARWAVGLYALTTGDVGGIAMAGTGLFNWRQVLMNLVGATAITLTFALVTDIFLGPLGMALAGLGLGSWTTEQARRKVLTTMKTELSHLLPQVAQEQSFVVYQVVKECFETYQQDVVKRMNADIAARKIELSDLIKQKESREIDRDGEIQRLNQLDDQVLAQSHQVEDAYDQVLGIHIPEMPIGTEEEAVADPAEVAEPSPEESQQAMLAAATV
jgi:hypothetical protein